MKTAQLPFLGEKKVDQVRILWTAAKGKAYGGQKSFISIGVTQANSADGAIIGLGIITR